MNVLINASNLKVGGGVQVALSIIESLMNDNRGISFYFVVSEPIKLQLNITDYLNHNVYICDINIYKYFDYVNSKKYLSKLELEHNIDIVFSIFGPSFWKPKKAKHLVGFANAWLVSPRSSAYKVYPFLSGIISRIKNMVLAKSLYDKDNQYVTETMVMKQRFCSAFKCVPDSIDVVSNCLSPYFSNVSDLKYDVLEKVDGIKFLTISHNYPHKNLESICEVGKLLREMGYKFIFVVTFTEQQYDVMSDVFKDFTYNWGPVDLRDCPKLYNSCDALYLPTLIECFSVSYLEAMAMKKPILTSDLPFAHDVCGKSAFYFDPYNRNDIALTISKFIDLYVNSPDEIDLIVESYEGILLKFGDNEQRVNSYLKILEKMYRKANV